MKIFMYFIKNELACFCPCGPICKLTETNLTPPGNKTLNIFIDISLDKNYDIIMKTTSFNSSAKNSSASIKLFGSDGPTGIQL